MVLEALAAISLTGNVIQFVHFACALVSKSEEIYRSVSGATAEYTELEAIAFQLRDFRSDIDNALEDDATRQGRNQRGANLIALAKQCRTIAADLLKAIEKVRCNPKARLQKFRSFRQSLVIVWNKQHVEELVGRLERARAQVVFLMMGNMRYGKL